MRRIDYYVLNPTGNITILVVSPVSEADQAGLALKLMEREPEAEQVGFVTWMDQDAGDSQERPSYQVRLRMAGGEFCGNAAMSTGALYRILHPKYTRNQVLVKVAGTKKPVQVDLERGSQGNWTGQVHMPQVEKMTALEDFPGWKVDLGGIIHVVTEASFEDRQAEALVKDWARSWETDAVGLMQVSKDQQSMRPLVYVDTAGTLFWENSCASGTSAAGAVMARIRGQVFAAPIRQPGGTLQVKADTEGRVWLKGGVSCSQKKEYTIDL